MASLPQFKSVIEQAQDMQKVIAAMKQARESQSPQAQIDALEQDLLNKAANKGNFLFYSRAMLPSIWHPKPPPRLTVDGFTKEELYNIRRLSLATSSALENRSPNGEIDENARAMIMEAMKALTPGISAKIAASKRAREDAEANQNDDDNEDDNDEDDDRDEEEDEDVDEGVEDDEFMGHDAAELDASPTESSDAEMGDM